MKSFLVRASIITFCSVMALTMGMSLAYSKSSSYTIDSSLGWKDQVDGIDKEIDKLSNQRNLYLAKATRLQNQGDRLQFESNNLLDARRAWQQAQINREIATRIQEEIDLLEKQRQGVLDKYGVKSYPRPVLKSS